MTKHIRRATWSEQYRSMPIAERRALCEILGIPYSSTIKNPPSSFELAALDILFAAGYNATRKPMHLLQPNEFIYQYPVGSLGYRVDIALPGRLVELYGCKYHGCASCGYKKPTTKRRDAARITRIEQATKLTVEIIWGHNTLNEISRRLVGHT